MTTLCDRGEGKKQERKEAGVGGTGSVTHRSDLEGVANVAAKEARLTVSSPRSDLQTGGYRPPFMAQKFKVD